MNYGLTKYFNQIGCVFAEYDLFKSTKFIQNLVHTDFCINFTQFYQFLKIGTSERTRKGFDQLLSNLGFSLYTLSFFLYSSFNPIMIKKLKMGININKFCNKKHFIQKKCKRAGQNAPIFILTSEMNSSCPITYKSTYSM